MITEIINSPLLIKNELVEDISDNISSDSDAILSEFNDLMKNLLEDLPASTASSPRDFSSVTTAPMTEQLAAPAIMIDKKSNVEFGASNSITIDDNHLDFSTPEDISTLAKDSTEINAILPVESKEISKPKKYMIDHGLHLDFYPTTEFYQEFAGGLCIFKQSELNTELEDNHDYNEENANGLFLIESDLKNDKQNTFVELNPLKNEVNESEETLLPFISDEQDFFIPAKNETIHSMETPAPTQFEYSTIPKIESHFQTQLTRSILEKSIDFTQNKWEPEFAERIYWMSSNQINSAKIQIHPMELGPIDVQIQIKDGLTQIVLAAEHNVTKHTLEQGIPALKTLFDENGLNLNSITIKQTETNAQEMGFSQQRQAPTHQSLPHLFWSEDEEVITHVTNLESTHGVGIVDYYA